MRAYGFSDRLHKWVLLDDESGELRVICVNKHKGRMLYGENRLKKINLSEEHECQALDLDARTE